MSTVVLSTAYFPPISYFSLIINHDLTLIETDENYLKQTYRNRCIIHAPGGKQSLSVPVERGSFHKTALRDLKIDYSRPWQKLHIKALNTSYNSSAFYEFFMDDIKKVIMKRNKFLLDLNNEALFLVCNMIGIEANIDFTGEFLHTYEDADDMRYSLGPKGGKGKSLISDIRYFQVFAQDNGFIPDLSILDLIFNMGPETWSVLRKKGIN